MKNPQKINTHHAQSKNFFHGCLRKFTLVSTTPERYQPGDQNVRQKVSISDTGITTYTAYSFTEGHRLVESVNRIFKISAEVTAELFSMISSYFGEEHLRLSFLEGGQWEITLSGEQQESVNLSSSFFDGQDPQLSVMSQALRQALGIPNLYAFDGLTDPLETVTMTIDSKVSLPDTQALSSYHEEIILDRASESLRMTQEMGQAGESFREYHIPGKVCDLLDNLSRRLSAVSGNTETVHKMDTMASLQNYQLQFFFSRGIPVCFSGVFSASDFPATVQAFIYRLRKLLELFTPAALNSDLYAHPHLREGQKILCDVRFNEIENYPCYYLATDDSVQIGDDVTVCIGTQKLEVLGTILRKLYVSSEDVTFSLERLNKIQNTDFYEFGCDILGAYSVTDMKTALKNGSYALEELTQFYCCCSNRVEWLSAERDTCCLPDSVISELSEWGDLKEHLSDVISHSCNTEKPYQSKSVISVLIQRGYQFLNGFWVKSQTAT